MSEEKTTEVDWEKKYNDLRAYNKQLFEKIVPELIAIRKKIESLG